MTTTNTDTNNAETINLETRAISEIEGNKGDLGVPPSYQLGEDLQTFYTSHTSAAAVEMSRAVATKLRADGYTKAAAQWAEHADCLEMFGTLLDGLGGLTEENPDGENSVVD